MPVLKKDMSYFVLGLCLDTPEPCMMPSQKGNGGVVYRSKHMNRRDWFSVLFEAMANPGACIYDEC